MQVLLIILHLVFKKLISSTLQFQVFSSWHCYSTDTGEEQGRGHQTCMVLLLLGAHFAHSILSPQQLLLVHQWMVLLLLEVHLQCTPGRLYPLLLLLQQLVPLQMLLKHNHVIHMHWSGMINLFDLIIFSCVCMLLLVLYFAVWLCFSFYIYKS